MFATRQVARSTKSSTSCSFHSCGSAGLRGWQTRTLHGRPGWSWRSIPDICRHRSSCALPRPGKTKSGSALHCILWGKFEAIGRTREREQTHLFGGDGLLRGLRQLFNGLGVVSQIAFASDEDDGKPLAEMEDFGNPLFVQEGQHESDDDRFGNG